MKGLLTYKTKGINDTIFRELVKRGYSQSQGSLSHRIWDISDSKLWYLTPELSKGFLDLYRFPPYRNLFEIETKLIQKNSSKVLKLLDDKKINVVELCCGIGRKAVTFIESLPKDVKMNYHPVDINPYFVENAVSRVSALNLKNVCVCDGAVASFDELPSSMAPVSRKDGYCNVILLFGATLSHYDLHEFLHTLSSAMLPGDVALIGNGIRPKGKRRFVNVKKYKDPVFHNWFIHIMKGLGFEEDEVEYHARFTHTRLEGYYKVKKDKVIEHDGKAIRFKKGDEIIVGVQYKYFAEELKKYLGMYFKKVEMFKDKDEEFGLFMCTK